MGAMRHSGVILAAALAVVSVAPPARAEPVAVTITTGASGLIEDQIHRAIDAELANSRTAPAGTLEVELSAPRHAVVTFRATSGRVTKREIDLPSEPKRANEAIALLAGNLARDEAGEILAELERGRASEAPPPEAPRSVPGAAPSPEAAPMIAPAPKAAPRAAPAPRAVTAADRQPKPKNDQSPERDAAIRKDDDFVGNLSLWPGIALLSDVEHRRVNVEVGFASRIGGLSGLMYSFGYGRVESDAEGFVTGLGFLRMGGKMRGAEASIGASSAGRLRGVAFAVGGNWVDQDAEGVALAAGFNRAGDFSGAELALVNVGGTVHGAQVGLVNVGGNVHGAQVGLVNVADRVDGVPVGLVNVIAEGRTQIVSWADSAAFAHVGVKYSNGSVYTLLAVGHALADSGRTHAKDGAASVALGAQFPLGDVWFAGGDVMYTAEVANEFEGSESGPRHVGRYRLLFGFDPSHTVSAFVGAGVEHVTALDGKTTARPYGAAGLALF
jgi:hypothetical protein